MVIVIYTMSENQPPIEVFGPFDSERDADDWVDERQACGWDGQFCITELQMPLFATKP